ncbi:MAG: hypothetical protein ACE5JB_14625 [bacterium]
MKKLIYISVFNLTLGLFSTVLAQTSGVFWIKTFSPGSSDLNDPLIDKKTLLILDSLMQDENIEVTFLGAADTLKWKMHGHYVHDNISEAWNDAKRLGRARALRARYGHGNVGVTHENIAGVKVLWSKYINQERYTMELNQLNQPNENLSREFEKVKSDLQTLKPEHGTNGTNSKNDHTKIAVKKGHNFNWRLQAGIWSWQSGSNGSILSPSLALSIITGKTALVIQGGVTPWHISTPNGNQAESFVYTGIKYMKSERYGITVGGFRGWKFFTETDSWALKTTGAAVGIVLTHGIIELNPTLTYSNVDSLLKGAHWHLGSTIVINFNVN